MLLLLIIFRVQTQKAGGGVFTNVCVGRYNTDAKTITRIIIIFIVVIIIIIIVVVVVVIVVVVIIIIIIISPCQN